MPTCAKFRENLNLQQFKVNQVVLFKIYFGTNRKRIYELLLVINSKFGPVWRRF